MHVSPWAIGHMEGTMKRLLARAAWFPVVAAALLMPTRAGADPIILNNSSFAFGLVSLLSGGVTISTHQFATTDWANVPLSGTWNFAGSIAGTPSGSVFVASSTRGTISASSLSGIGLTSNRASVQDIAPALSSTSWAASIYNVSFELTERTPFTYSAHYFGTSDALFDNLVGRLDRSDEFSIFTDRFSRFQDLDENRTHSGVLAPGRYMIFLASDPGQLVAPGGTSTDGGFEFSLQLGPATGAEVPEPSTLLLVGGGLALLARRRAVRCVPHWREGRGGIRRWHGGGRGVRL
jgi:hypothetical protein